MRSEEWEAVGRCGVDFFFFFFGFFFQAEDGIRDRLVTGVQTCALPICNVAVEVVTPSRDDVAASARFLATRVAAPRMGVNYPNPFNPETWIPYQLSDSAPVTITIYDMAGAVIRRLDLGQQAAGVYASRGRAAYWDGRDQQGETAASGVYVVQLRAGAYRESRRMLLRK